MVTRARWGNSRSARAPYGARGEANPYSWTQSLPVHSLTALREAQASVQPNEKWKHPAFWAAWTLWGLGD